MLRPEPETRGGIQCRLDGPVGRITLCRADRHNAFDGPMLDAFDAALGELTKNAECRVIVIDGDGPSFCAGWDTRDFATLAELGTEGLSLAFARNARVLERLSASHQIIVTAVQGACMGFGIGLAARSDICVASDTARFALPELEHGIVPGMVLGDAIQAMGHRTAMEWALTRDKQSAAQAMAAGLVHRVFEAADFEAKFDAMAQKLAKPTSKAIAETKALGRLNPNDERFMERAIAASTQSVLSLFERKPSR